ncbi:unnamed protein product, partial [Laminaria digitata]
GLVPRDFQPLLFDDAPLEPIQSRTWAAQVNLSLGVRYGQSGEIGSRRAMEDRTTIVSDIFRPEDALAEESPACCTGVVGEEGGDKGNRRMFFSAPAPL